MRIVAIQSVPLSRQCREAWRDNGVTLLRRSRSTGEIVELLDRRRPYDVIINLGRSDFNYSHSVVYNPSVVVGSLMTPGNTRITFDFLEVLPPIPTEFPADVWIKGQGRGGSNKVRMTMLPGHSLAHLPENHDVQEHVEGQEYRLITVGHKIVQCFERYGDNDNREYRWVRMREVSDDLKDMARLAAKQFHDKTIISWDMVIRDSDRRPFIFEGNTSPGVNTHTVRRIVTQIRKDIENADTM